MWKTAVICRFGRTVILGSAVFGPVVSSSHRRSPYILEERGIFATCINWAGSRPQKERRVAIEGKEYLPDT